MADDTTSLDANRYARLAMVLSSRRKQDSSAAKRNPAPVVAPQDEKLDEQKEMIGKLTLEGLKVYQRFLEECQMLDAQGRLYLPESDEPGDAVESTPPPSDSLEY